jgi:unsaturated rhamnogalacturonyl hydrolase
MKKTNWIYIIALVILTQSAIAQTKPWSQRMAATAMTLWKDSLNGNWTYDHGVIMKGIERVWEQTGDPQYFKYVQHSIDKFVTADGNILKYKQADYNIDNVLNGRNVLTLFNVLGTPKYYKAASILREQLKNQPRIPEGGFWHKKRYPNQMWLDGLYMGEPFYAEYATLFHEDTAFNDIAKQFILMESHARDPKTGLLYHAWDQSKQQKWADPKTGLSPNFWGRAMGWYGMALVDVLDFFPKNHPQRKELIAILNRMAASVQKYQDPASGVWYQVLDKGGKKGNYLEASASCMFVYALAKGVREGYLPAKYQAVAQKGFNGILKEFVTTDADGQTNLNKVCSVAGLGGNPYRDGSYEYYLSEKVVTNDPKGVGAFIQAAVEIERLAGLNAAKGKTVMLDSYFNNEHRKDITGAMVSYHYKWDEKSNNGFYFLGHLFKNQGFETATLFNAPTAANLKQASIYVVVDPDIPKENPDAKYIEEAHVKAISDWVKAGGVLVVLHNDTGNAEFQHLNGLMSKFGMQFNHNSVNKVQGQQFEQGGIAIPAGNSVFKSAKKIYIKEISTLAIKAPATAALSNKGDVIVATAKYGKGTVFAVGDPWFYDEYTDGRKLPADFQNYEAANDLVKWVVKQLPVKK